MQIDRCPSAEQHQRQADRPGVACAGRELRGARDGAETGRRHPFRLSRLVLLAWDAASGEISFTEAQWEEEVELRAEVLRIVSDILDKAVQLARASASSNRESLTEATLPMSMEYGCQDIMGFQEYASSQSGSYCDVSPLGVSGMNTSHF